MQTQTNDARHKQKTKTDAAYTETKKHRERAAQKSDQGSLKIWCDDDDQGKQQEKACQYRKRTPEWHQTKQTAKRHGYAFAAAKPVKEREGMSQHRRGKHQRAWHEEDLFLMGAGKQKDRDKAFQQIAAQSDQAAPESAITKRVDRTGVAILTFFIFSVLMKQRGSYSGKQDASADVAKQRIGHDLFHLFPSLIQQKVTVSRWECSHFCVQTLKRKCSTSPSCTS